VSASLFVYERYRTFKLGNRVRMDSPSETRALVAVSLTVYPLAIFSRSLLPLSQIMDIIEGACRDELGAKVASELSFLFFPFLSFPFPFLFLFNLSLRLEKAVRPSDVLH
jgi:hypothetical protein